MTTSQDHQTDECDYLVIGGGASGMAFCDSLLGNSRDDSSSPRVIVVDKHETPGGQWHDSYNFVQLHQPSKGYGVESKKLETPQDEDDHRATRSEILNYYAGVAKDLQEKHDFEFWGNTTLDLAQLYDGNPSRDDYVVTDNTTGVSRTVRVRKRLVDARNLEPDLPVLTPPKFSFSDKLSVVPVNDIATADTSKKHFVVIGGGKTGMDAVYYLIAHKKIPPEDLLWVVPNDAWITAREKIGNCIDLLYTSAQLCEQQSADSDEKKEADHAAAPTTIGTEFFQRGFLEWEKQGHMYRLDSSVVPTKFKDATLSKEELTVLQTAVPRMVREGRISELTNDGTFVFEKGSTKDLPFPAEDTLFLHCSAGAFHCSKSHQAPPPIFQDKRIIVQDIYGTPGYCFVGSMLGKLESMSQFSDKDRNRMTLSPKPSEESTPPLGKSGGDIIGKVNGDHPWIQRAHNLKLWLQDPELSRWLFENRLFHLAHQDPEIVSNRVRYIFRVLENSGILSPN